MLPMLNEIGYEVESIVGNVAENTVIEIIVTDKIDFERIEEEEEGVSLSYFVKDVESRTSYCVVDCSYPFVLEMKIVRVNNLRGGVERRADIFER
ncbi:hypothetical protein GIB67_017724 [Kingdonia uniflora]|uniref:Uncharacterized protein n=1 Tax=Kingdonia uniflora TaxID=39325 RepID=A0A7J7NAU4_9MAGN|nr:hypothetical protein GIB67_017724 [Kingdonia uniflora]